MSDAHDSNEKLDDVASRPPDKHLELTLDEVGLENVQSQVQLQGLLLPAKSQACVSLVDKHARGIHMSRLFKILSQMHEQELSWPWLSNCLEQMLVSHDSLSDAGRLQVSFELPVLRKALLSQEHGWRSYPLTYEVVASAKGKRELNLTARVLYSSTCPCSAGLSRQAMQDEFRKVFKEPSVHVSEVMKWLSQPNSVPAIAHSQRSEAIVKFTIDSSESVPSALSLIDEIENALGTPVQAAVKREDEQEFARRNAQNLMFCEDAARKLKSALLKRDDVADFAIEVRHFESLHPHDVVAKVRKND
jgi:GTP cyclohydrolase IB